MLQALNILENADLKAMGYNSPRYIHTLYQAMSLAFADRDFYYGDPYLPARGAGEGAAVEGVRQGALRADRLDPQRLDRQAGRPLSVPGRDQSLRVAARRDGHRCRRQDSLRQAGHHRLRVPRAVLRRHHVDRGGRRAGMGRVGDAERRVDPGGDRGPHRRRAEPAGPELRDSRGGRAVQRDRAGQASPGHADADPGDEGRPAVPRLRGAGRRLRRTRTCCSGFSTSSSSG